VILEQAMVEYELILPPDFDDYAWEVESKGWFSGAVVKFSGKKYSLNFYDSSRLSQEIADELSAHPMFVEDNLVVLESIDRSHMEKAVESLARSGKYNCLKADAETV
jgi:hypothetical protein